MRCIHIRTDFCQPFDIVTYGSELHFENDTLIVLQIATKYIMIIIFELIYNIYHSDIIDYRNKLIINAKYIIIQAKNISLL